MVGTSVMKELNPLKTPEHIILVFHGVYNGNTRQKWMKLSGEI